MRDSVTSTSDPVLTMSEASCPFCETRSGEVWGRRDELPIYKCGACGVVFFDRKNVPVSDYHYYYDYAKGWNEDRVRYELKIRAKAYRKQLKRITSLATGSQMLEIGAGPGYFSHVASNAGFQVVSTEINPISVELGRKFLGVKYKELKETPLGVFDVVCCFHVLEHMFEPALFLQSVRSRMHSGSLLVVHVPYQEPLSYWIRNRLFRSNMKLCALYAPEHLSGFTVESLRKGVERFGFRMQSGRTVAMWSMYYDPFFIRNYITSRNWKGIVKHGIRHVIENVGAFLDRGDWIVAYFKAI